MKNKNKKLLFSGLGLLLLIVLFFLFKRFSIKYFWCQGHYIVPCMQNLEDKEIVIREKISCFNDNDCSAEKMNNFCKPGHSSLLKCINAKYYCSRDGYCQGCGC